jgi:hypothetical protein
MKTIKLTKSEIEHILCLISINELEGVYPELGLKYWKRSFRIKNKLISDPHYFCPICGTDHKNKDYFGFCCEECFNQFNSNEEIK